MLIWQNGRCAPVLASPRSPRWPPVLCDVRKWKAGTENVRHWESQPIHRRPTPISVNGKNVEETVANNIYRAQVIRRGIVPWLVFPWRVGWSELSCGELARARWLWWDSGDKLSHPETLVSSGFSWGVAEIDGSINRWFLSKGMNMQRAFGELGWRWWALSKAVWKAHGESSNSLP